MTITQILTLTIGCLALLLSSELIRSTLKQRRSATVDTTPAFRQVGTFGGFGSLSHGASPLPSTGSSGRGVLAFFILLTLAGMGGAVKFAWDETHPDLRSAYGRAYERCVSENKISRWNVEEVERCIDTGRGYNG